MRCLLVCSHAVCSLWSTVVCDPLRMGACRWQQTVGEYDKADSTLTATSGWHESMVHDDPLHVLFVQGIGNWTCGSALLKLAQNRLFNSSPGAPASLDGQLKEGWLKFKAWSKCNKAAFTAAEWSTNAIHYHKTKDFPCLGGKAADVRLTVFFLAHFLTDLAATPDNRQHAWLPIVAACFAHLATFLHTLGSADIIMSSDEAIYA
jgi:hypothetical protein